jgi:hypothetical protein
VKKIILAALVSIILTAATIPQFFYYNQTRKAIAIRSGQSGSVEIRDRLGQAVMKAEYPANSSRWISVNRLAPGLYTATTDGVTINFYRQP